MIHDTGFSGIHRMGYVLDLARPELTPLMQRYVRPQPVSRPDPLPPPTALVVTRSKSYQEPMIEALGSPSED